MKRIILSLVFCGLLAFGASAQQKKAAPHSVRMVKSTTQRTEIILPQVQGYNIYKADFHIHTSYSDGCINPAGRVSEAWLDGLDIIAITDHFESHKGVQNFFKVTAPYNDDCMPTEYMSASKAGDVMIDFDAIHNEAAKALEKRGYPMLLIKGCEMARNAQTHGHYNCLFLKNFDGLYNKDMLVAFKRVHDQGGIVVHNHPGWRRKTTDKTEFHEKAYSAGLIDGVEVVNGSTFYPYMVKRCIDEKLTMFANTDIHGSSSYSRMSPEVFRTMTFVLAKSLTEEDVKEAVLAHRTLAYVGGNVIGEEKWLAELLNESVDCRIVQEYKEKGRCQCQITNNSSITYTLRRGKRTLVLEPLKSVFITLGKDEKGKKYALPKFRVENMWHVDYQHPTIEIKLD